MQQGCGTSAASRSSRTHIVPRSATPPRPRSVTPPRLRAANSDRLTSGCDETRDWIKRTTGAALVGIATLSVAANPAAAAQPAILQVPSHALVNVGPHAGFGASLNAAAKRQARAEGGNEANPAAQKVAGVSEMVQQLQQKQQQHQNQLQLLQQHGAVLDKLSAEGFAAELDKLRSELERVRQAETSALTALRSHEEALLRLASQLKEAAHSEISTLQATEGRLLSVVQNSAQRLKEMQQQQQQLPSHRMLTDTEQLIETVLSGGFIMVAGGATASAAAVYAATHNGFGRRTRKAPSNNSDIGRSSNNGKAGRVVQQQRRQADAVAAAATTIRPSNTTVATGNRRRRKDSQQRQLQQQELRVPEVWHIGGSWQPNLLDMINAEHNMQQDVADVTLLDLVVDNHKDSHEPADSHDVIQQIENMAAEAVSTAATVHTLQQQDAETAVKAAELAASATDAERRVTEAMQTEAHAAQRFLQLERAAKEAAEAHAAELAAQVLQLQDAFAVQEQQRRGGSGASVAVGVLQQQLQDAQERLAAATQIRMVAEGELRELTTALVHEQQQSARIAQELESAQLQLQEVSFELQALQQQLLSERNSHKQAIAHMAAESDALTQQLQQQHRLQLQEQEAEQAAVLQAQEQHLCGELQDVKGQLAAALEELQQERDNSAKLHEQVARLHEQFADARANLNAERTKASALAEQRKTLEVALELAATQAAAAETEAEAAREEAKAIAQQAQQAQQQLDLVSEEKHHVVQQLETVNVKVEQQQDVLKEQQKQMGQLQEEVMATRDALRAEQQRASGLEGLTSHLQQRITNMAAVREEGNKQLTGQLNKLRAQLQQSKRNQQESQAQLKAYHTKFSVVERRLAAEQANSSQLSSTAQELQQRLAHLHSADGHHAAAAQVAKEEHKRATAAAVAAAGKLAQTTKQLSQQLATMSDNEDEGSEVHVEGAADVDCNSAAQQDTLEIVEVGIERANAVASAAATALAEKDQQLQWLQQQQEVQTEQLQEARQQLAQAEAEAAAVVQEAEAAMQQQLQQQQYIKEQLNVSQRHAAAARAAEATARQHAESLQQQLEQHRQAAAHQAAAMDAVKAQLVQLKQKTADSRHQMEAEKEKALAYEATAQELKDRIASLQHLRHQQQLQHGSEMAALLAQIKEANVHAVEAAETKKRAETRFITAYDDIERRQYELTSAHKRQAELEQRLAEMVATGRAPSAAVAALQQQLAVSSRDLGTAAHELRELEQHYLDARGALLDSETHAEGLALQLESKQAKLQAASQAAREQAEASAQEQHELQQQLQHQQEQLEQGLETIEQLRIQASSARAELTAQQEMAAQLQQQAAKLQQQLAATEASKEAAEKEAEQLRQELTEAQEGITELQYAQAETEQVAAQVAADLAAAREWAHSNSARFVEAQQQLGSYQADLMETQEDLRLTNERLEAAQQQHAAVDQQLVATKQQLADEQAAHDNTHGQLGQTRMQLDVLKEQYIVARDGLEAERQTSMQLERVVTELRDRLTSLQRLRERQIEVSAAERSKWQVQVVVGLQHRDQAGESLEHLQQEYFHAFERLDQEQHRVQGLENVVAQLEAKLGELSQLALAAPAAGALDIGGGPATELVVVSGQLKSQWKEAQAALATSRSMLAVLEQEYKESRMAVDAEHERCAQVEDRLEFLQERLAAAERSVAGEEAEFQRSTAELHNQIQAQAGELVACQLRISALKDELAASRKRLEDEQQQEAQLALKAQDLEIQSAAAGNSLFDMEQEMLKDKPSAASVGVSATSDVAYAINGSVATAAAAAAAAELSQDVSAKQQRQQQQQDETDNEEVNELAQLEAGQLLQQLTAVLNQAHATSSASGISKGESSCASSSSNGNGTSKWRSNLASHSTENTEGTGSIEVVVDMAMVKKHVEDMARQYVMKLSLAEQELRAVRSVWQQAEAELTELRKQQQQPYNGSRGYPGVPGAASDTHASMHELAQLAPVRAVHHVSGSSHAAAEAEHGLPDQILLELPSPVFEGQSAGAAPWIVSSYQISNGHGSSNGASSNSHHSSSNGGTGTGTSAGTGNSSWVRASNDSHVTEVNGIDVHSLSGRWAAAAERLAAAKRAAAPASDGSSYATEAVADDMASTTLSTMDDDMLSDDDVVTMRQAIKQGMRSSSSNTRVTFRPVNTSKALNDGHSSNDHNRSSHGHGSNGHGSDIRSGNGTGSGRSSWRNRVCDMALCG